MKLLRTRLDDERGLIGVLGVLGYGAIMLIIGISMITGALANLRVAGQRVASTQSLYNAESGAEDALLQMRRDVLYGTTTANLTTTFDDTNRVETEITTVTESGCNPARQVTAAGFTGELVRRIRLTNCAVASTNAQFAYALQAGDGGISMDNNAVINGSSYSNGNHTGSPGARVSGDVWVAGAPAANPTPAYDPASSTEHAFANVATKIDVAQSFVADTSSSNKLVRVSLKVRKFGNPANATVRIVSDDGNKPGATEIGTGTLNAAVVGSSPAFVDVSLSSVATLTNGTRYWIVIDAPGHNAANYWAWFHVDGYGGGKGMYSDRWRSGGNMTWTDTGGDFVFRVFMGSPATYAQQLQVGGAVHANTITDLQVTGDAYFQTNNGSTIQGASYPNSADPAAVDLPISDANISDFQVQATSGVVYSGNYTVPLGTTQTLGPMKIEGDLLVENNAIVIMYGTIWVTGNITFENNTVLRLDPGYGGDSGTIMADGVMSFVNNTTAEGNGPNSFILAVSTKSGGTAITVNNNATGLILVATKGTLVVSNNGTANALAAYRLELQNNSIINYVTGMANVNFSAGPGASFKARGWREVVLD